MSARNPLLGITVCILGTACATLAPGGSGLEKIEHRRANQRPCS